MKQLVQDVTSDNVDAARTAAVISAGGIANKQLAKLASSKAPLMLKGYIDTPVGKLVIANIAAQVIKQTRPNDTKLAALAEGMIVSAYQEAIAVIDIDGLIDSFLEDKAIQRATATL